MKRILSVLLALIMVMSLVGVAGISALAAEDELTIVLTGGTGAAIGGEGLGFATAAAIKETYDDNAVLLVDAGGFDAGAGAIMTAAGYDLVVPGGVMDDWAVTSIAMNNGVLKPGAMFEKNGVKVAFVAVEPIGDMDEEVYYDILQGAVTGARDTGAEYVIALGRVDDANAVIENVTGIDAILTYGGTAIKALPGEITEEADETAEVGDGEEAQVEENEEALVEDGESEQPAQALYVSVGSEFDSIGIVTIKGNMLYAETVNAESAEALNLEESSAILALEAAFQAAQPQDETDAEGEEPAGETDEFAEEGAEPVGEGEETVEETEPAGEGESEEAESTADAEPVKEDGAEETQETEETAQETEESAEGAAEETTEETAEQTEETAADTEKTEETAADAEETEEKTEEEAAAAEPTPVIDAASDSDAEETEKKDEEETAAAEPTPVLDAATPNDAEPANTPTEYIRGNDDLELTFEHKVKEVQIKDGSSFKEFEAKYYELLDDGKTVAISSSVLNDWPDGNFEFKFLFDDGTEAETVLVKISGDKPEEEETEPADDKQTDDTSKQEESKATPAPAKETKKASTPATGDTSPIGLYAAILGVMVVALAVVIILVVRKKKMEK